MKKINILLGCGIVCLIVVGVYQLNEYLLDTDDPIDIDNRDVPVYPVEYESFFTGQFYNKFWRMNYDFEQPNLESKVDDVLSYQSGNATVTSESGSVYNGYYEVLYANKTFYVICNGFSKAGTYDIREGYGIGFYQFGNYTSQLFERL